MKPSSTLLRMCGKGNRGACNIARKIYHMQARADMYAGAVLTFANVKSNDDNPNKMPYEGTLLLVDVASTKPPHGSQGHKIYVPKKVAQEKLPGIIGMAINYDPGGLDEHATRHKVGVITKAWLSGNKVKVSGFVYKKDFPEAVQDLRGRNDLGMSMELADVYVRNENEDVWHLEDFEFTGATILKKDAAAYRQTDLAAVAAAASGEKGEHMPKQEKKEKKVAAAHRDTGQSSGQLALMTQAISGSLGESLSRALGPVVAEIKASNERVLEGFEELKGLHLINAAADTGAGEDDDEVVLHAAKEEDASDEDDMAAASDEDDDMAAASDEDDDMAAADADMSSDESSASDNSLDAMEDLELEDASQEPGEVNKDASNRGKKTSVTKPPKQGEHFPGNVAKGRLHSRAAKGSGKMKKLFPGIKGSGLSIQAAAVQIGRLQAAYEETRRTVRTLKAQVEKSAQTAKKYKTKFRTVQAQVERFAELESRRSIMPVELTNLAAKAGLDLGEIKAAGQKMSVPAVDAMFARAQQQGILLDPQERIGLKMLMEQEGLIDQGVVSHGRA